MIQNIKINFTNILAAMICFAAIPVLQAQVVIGQPSLEFSKACAGEEFNTFETIFSFNPESALSSTNQFVVELSDATGDFTNAINVFESDPGEITVSPATVSFSLPLETAGEFYKIRIKSTDPEATSAPSLAFPAYYKLHDTPFTINNLVGDATFCPGAGYLLTIDNPGYDGTISPLTFDSLNFNWFKVIDETNSVWVAQGESFLTDEEGTYFAETDYGSCSSESFSNRVTISQATTDEPASAVITSSLGTSFCSNGEGTTLTTIQGGTSYEWFRNDEPISGADSHTVQTTQSGYYAVIVTLGDCVSVGSIEIESLSVNVSLDVPSINFIETGQSLVVNVSSSLEDAEYEWYLNDNLIEGATQSSFSASELGIYKVLIVTSGQCDEVSELTFELRLTLDSDSIPNLITPNGDGINDTWLLPTEYLSGSNAEIMIVSSNGEMVLETKDYLNNWPENIEDIEKLNQVFYYMITPQNKEPLKGSITVVQ